MRERGSGIHLSKFSTLFILAKICAHSLKRILLPLNFGYQYSFYFWTHIWFLLFFPLKLIQYFFLLFI